MSYPTETPLIKQIIGKLMSIAINPTNTPDLEKIKVQIIIKKPEDKQTLEEIKQYHKKKLEEYGFYELFPDQRDNTLDQYIGGDNE